MSALAKGHYGSVSLQSEFGAFRISLRHYPANLRTPSHVHDQPGIVVPFSGEAYQSHGRSSRLLRRGTQRFELAENLHADRVGPGGWGVLSITFSELVRQQLIDLGCPFRAVRDTSVAEAVGLMDRAVALAKYAPAPSVMFRMQSLVYELLSEFVDEPSHDSDRTQKWLRKSREYLLEHFRERPAVETIARAVSVHPVHLARAFRARYGQTIGEFRRSLSVAEGVRLLRSTDDSIAEIASALGYSPSHFTMLILENVGVPPSRLR